MIALKIVLGILCAVTMLFVFLCSAWFVMAKPGKKRDTSYFSGKMYAHRGLHDTLVPENSLSAFRLAKEAGYGVELDVQMTKDGQLVVFHDGTLKRVCGVDGNLRDYTYSELKEFRLKDTAERIPLFSEVLETLDGMDIICEIKSDNGIKNYELCEKTYDMLAEYNGRYCIESFSPFLVGWFKKNHPEVIRGQLSENFVRSSGLNPLNFALTHLFSNVISRPDFVAYNHHDAKTLGFVLCKKICRPLCIAWTAKGTEEQEQARNSFDSIIFEKNKG